MRDAKMRRFGVKIIETQRELVEGGVVRQGHAGSPGSDGASPYLRTEPHPSYTLESE